MLGLVVQLEPLPDESLPGYLYRLAAGNGVTGSQVIKLFRERSREGEVELPVAMVDAWRPMVAQLLNPGGKPLRIWNASVRRFCPCCLAQSEHWRWHWDLTLMVTCPIHQRPMVDKCPDCGRLPTWGDSSLTNCFGCRASFTGRTPPHQDPSGAWLANELMRRWPRHDPDPTSPFQHHGLEEFHEMATCLAVRRERSDMSKPRMVPGFDTLRVARPLAYAAEEVLSAWPQGFHQLLQRLAKPQKSFGHSISRAFGVLYSDIYRRLSAPCHQLLREEVERFLATNWVGALSARHRRLSSTCIDDHSWLSVTTAATKFGLNRSLLLRMIAAGELGHSSSKDAAGRFLQLVDARDLQSQHERLKGLLNQKEMAERLGLPQSRIQQLTEAGILPFVGGPSTGTTPWFLCASKLNELQVLGERLERRAEKQNETSVYDVLRYGQLKATGVAELLNRILSGRQPCTARTGPPEQVGGWLIPNARRENLACDEPPPIGLTIPELCARMSMKQEVAYALVRSGIIEAVRTPHGTGRAYLISDEAIRRFQANYAFGTEIARKLAISPKKLCHHLLERGVLPAAGPTIRQANCRQYLWKRTLQLDNALVEIDDKSNNAK